MIDTTLLFQIVNRRFINEMHLSHCNEIWDSVCRKSALWLWGSSIIVLDWPDHKDLGVVEKLLKPLVHLLWHNVSSYLVICNAILIYFTSWSSNNIKVNKRFPMTESHLTEIIYKLLLQLSQLVKFHMWQSNSNFFTWFKDDKHSIVFEASFVLGQLQLRYWYAFNPSNWEDIQMRDFYGFFDNMWSKVVNTFRKSWLGGRQISIKEEDNGTYE